jgi:membrane protein YdbS with pleckstrin-like domain
VDGWPVVLVTYRLTTLAGAAVLAALAFRQGTEGWDIVGAVFITYAIVDAMLLIVVASFRWRHRREWHEPR